MRLFLRRFPPVFSFPCPLYRVSVCMEGVHFSGIERYHPLPPGVVECSFESIVFYAIGIQHTQCKCLFLERDTTGASQLCGPKLRGRDKYVGRKSRNKRVRKDWSGMVLLGVLGGGVDVFGFVMFGFRRMARVIRYHTPWYTV